MCDSIDDVELTVPDAERAIFRLMSSYSGPPSTGWTSRNQLDPHLSHPTHPLPSPSSAHSSPRIHFKQPRVVKNSTLKVFQSVFGRQQSRSSANSLHSLNSGGSASLVDISVPPLFVPMPPAPVPVVSSHESADDEQECPVCLEPLSFSFRLPGEKPHVVPECGHSLHEVSFLASPAAFHSYHLALTHPRRIGLLYRRIRPSPQPVPLTAPPQSKLGRLWCM